MTGELLALADDAAIEVAQKSDAAKADAKPGAAKAEAKAAPQSEQKSDGKSDTKALDTKPADAKSADATSADTKADGAKSTEVPPVEYEPFDKVSGMIRNRIAQQKVDEKVAAAFRTIQTQMDRYRTALDGYRAKQTQGNSSAKKPEPPDLEALAKPFGFEVKKTELATVQQMYDGYDIGKSHQPVSAGNYSTPPFYQIAYQMGPNNQPVVKLFQTDESEDNELNRYLWWKIADQAANIPPLDQMKPDVVTAWKMIKAREAAMAKAKEYAAQVNKSGDTLKAAYGNLPETEVLTDGPFSWLSRTLDQGPRISTVKGVEMAGDQFMKDVFALKQGEAGVAVNEPQTIYYVTRIDSEEPSTEKLRDDFMNTMRDPMGQFTYAIVAAKEAQNYPIAWYKELANEYEFKMAPGHTFSQLQELD